MTNRNLEAALHHIGKNRPIFPCSGVTKQPLTPNGFKDATTDEAQIRAWWHMRPDAVPGMPTGMRTGIFVLDIDVKNGQPGEETLKLLQRTFGKLPDTVTVLSPSGGFHLYLRHPRDGRLVPNKAGHLGQGTETWGKNGFPAVPFEVSAGGLLVTPGADIRGDGGYVIAPGAVMADGHTYEFEGSSDPDEGNTWVATPPDSWLPLVCRDPSAPPATDGRKVSPEPIPEGGRNDHLYRLGCSLRSRGLAESVIVATLLAENLDRCRPPLPNREVVATGKSAASKPPGLSPEYERRRANAQANRNPRPPAGAAGGQALRGDHDDRFDPPTPAGGGPAGASPPGGGGEKGVHPGTGAPLPAAHQVAPEQSQRSPPNEPPGTDSGTSPPGGDLPAIQIVDGHLPEAIDDAEHSLVEAGVGIYQRGDQGLVRIAAYAGVPSAKVVRDRGAVVITPVTPEWLVDTMTRHIRWQRWDVKANDLRRKDAPASVARGLLARGGQWRFPYLTGFCSSPLLDLDGRVIASPGYDAPTGLYLTGPPRIEPIEATDQNLAEGAGERMADLLGIGIGVEPEKFPFALPVDYSAALAMVMTALLRPILPTAPICAVSAATAGTGKSLWVDVVSTIATGRNATVVNMGKDTEEAEKRIGAQLMLGESFSIDNIEGAFRSETLCTAATQESMNVRILSQSRMARVPTRVTIYLTGNNVTPLGDLVRRVLLARMDAGCERPELREFETDALERARSHRAEVIRCALLISRAYCDAGRPKVDAPPTGSFRTWDELVRFPLIWSGLPDPLGQWHSLKRKASFT